MNKHPLQIAVERGKTPVELLNAITTIGYGWVERSARKNYEDEFGNVISNGSSYYARDTPGGVMPFRLSKKSMNALLNSVFGVNYDGTELACHRAMALELAQREVLAVAALKLSHRSDEVSPAAGCGTSERKNPVRASCIGQALQSLSKWPVVQRLLTLWKRSKSSMQTNAVQ